MSSDNPTLLVVVASTRPGRIDIHVGRWIEEAAETHGGFDVRFADLAELALPFMDEPRHPRLRQYEHQHTTDWSAIVDAADTFLFVTPEYNHGYNAVLKNALDFLHAEWADKPAGLLVSYGGIAAGTRAVQQLKPVLAALRMVPVVEGVNIPFVAKHVQDGVFRPTAETTAAATGMLDELARLTDSLRPTHEAELELSR